MPIYEYECQNCKHRLEALQKFSDEPLVDCPECYKPLLNKLISAAGFTLKGSGWYATDYKDKAKPTTSESAPTDKKSNSNDSNPNDSSAVSS